MEILILETAPFTQLSKNIREWASELGFQGSGITDTQLGENESHLENWLAENFHGEMSYMAAHGKKRSRPAELIENTTRIISLRMDYLPEGTKITEVLDSDSKAYIARYTMGRDYHKVIRKKLVKLWSKIDDYCDTNHLGKFNGRVFTDSAPVLEKAIAEKAGLGWIGKNTLLLNRNAGSWFFLGEIFTDIPLALDQEYKENHCGSCSSCIDVCPTKAIVAPYKLDARKCISYLTIENKGEIDLSLRKAMGNRIFGCDDCQIYCPWNKFAKHTSETDFTPRHELDNSELLDLFSWTEDEFLKKTEGSAIRRTGFQGWQRNIAVALGNANYSLEIVRALESKRAESSPLVLEHIDWALEEQRNFIPVDLVP
ncbi:MAG: epoxyqueuosine reductase [Candidatus Azotimanducaceae bacterium]